MLLELHDSYGLTFGLPVTRGLSLPPSWFALVHVASAFASVVAVYLMLQTMLRRDLERLVPLSQHLLWSGVVVLFLSLLSSLANYLVGATTSMQTDTTPQVMIAHSRHALSPMLGGLCTLIGCLVVRIHVLWKVHLGSNSR